MFEDKPWLCENCACLVRENILSITDDAADHKSSSCEDFTTY